MRNENLEPIPARQFRADRSPVNGWALIVLIVAIALGVGAAIGTGNLLLGALILLMVAAFGYMLFVRHITWQLAVLICFLQLHIEPGFAIGANEIGSAFCLVLIVVQLWHKQPPSENPFFQSNAFQFFRNVLFLWLFYAAARFIWNQLTPYNPDEYAFSNAIKSEFWVSAVILVMWLFCLRPWNFRVRPGFSNLIAVFLLIGLLFNIAVRIYGIKQGIFSDDAPTDDDAISSVINVPGIKLTEGLYALRFLGPTAVLFGVIFLSSPRQKGISLGMRLVYGTLIIGGIGGTSISGGRGGILLAGAFCLGILIARRKILALFLLGLGIFFGFCLLNIYSQKIVSDPALMVIARSFYWAMMDQPEARAAGDSINSSTLWRQELFDRAVDEWKSDPVIFWFGRGTYKFSEVDKVAMEIDEWSASLDTSLRRGATHNLITDLLIAYGLVGLVIYLVVCLALIRICWRMFKHPGVPEDARDLALICTIQALYTVLYGITAGGFYGIESGIFVAILLGRIANSPAESFPEVAGDTRRLTPMVAQ